MIAHTDNLLINILVDALVPVVAKSGKGMVGYICHQVTEKCWKIVVGEGMGPEFAWLI